MNPDKSTDSICLSGEKSNRLQRFVNEEPCFQDRTLALNLNYSDTSENETLINPINSKHLFQTQTAHQAFDLKSKSYSAIRGAIRNNISAKIAQSKTYIHFVAIGLCSVRSPHQPLNETNLSLIQDSQLIKSSERYCILPSSCDPILGLKTNPLN